MTTLSPLFTWRSAIVDSDLPPSSRLVALALSLHMNERGESCFPSQPTLARETGLSERAVREHLRILWEKGWIGRQKRSGKSDLFSSQTPANGSGVPRQQVPAPRNVVPLTPAAGAAKDVQESVNKEKRVCTHKSCEGHHRCLYDYPRERPLEKVS